MTFPFRTYCELCDKEKSCKKYDGIWVCEKCNEEYPDPGMQEEMKNVKNDNKKDRQ